MISPNHLQRQRLSRMVPVLLLSLIAGLSASPVLADEVVPPPPPVVDIPPPPPIPANIDPSEVRHAVARPVYEKPAPSEVRRASYETQVAQPAQTAQVQYASYGDPYGFTSWLNGVRAQYGLGPVSYDPNLSGQAAVNNGQQHARGMGHHYMGSARRQNSGMGAAQTVWQMWMASPAHQAALLDPTITMIGIAASGSYWTFNAY